MEIPNDLPIKTDPVPEEGTVPVRQSPAADFPSGHYQQMAPGDRLPKDMRAESRIFDIPANGLKISVGCGRHTLPDWFCIDVQQNPQATRPLDMVSDIKKIDLPDACASMLIAIHIFEHLYRWECDDTLQEWRRLLRPKGMLVLEMPDLMKCCRNVLEGRRGPKHEDQFGMWGLYGDPGTEDPLMTHRWGWTFKSVKPLLEKNGFYDLNEKPTQWHMNGHTHRDFRVEARKR